MQLSIFDLALKEQRFAVGEIHPDVAEMHLNISNMQVEVVNLDYSIDKYLEALMILRMTCVNRYFEVCNTLHNLE